MAFTGKPSPKASSGRPSRFAVDIFTNQDICIKIRPLIGLGFSDAYF